MKSKYLVVLAIVVAMLMLGLCAGCAADDSKPSEGVTPSLPTSTTGTNETAVPSEEPLPSPTPALTPTPEPTPEPVTQLPPLESVTVESNPLLYDFLNSCVDWHVSVHRDQIESTMYVVWHDTTPHILYVDNYVIQAGITFPPGGQAIERHELTPGQLTTFELAVQKSPTSQLLSEDGWNLFVFAGPEVARVYDAGIELWSAVDYTDGNPMPFLESGEGWPTEWLRREPYVSAIKERRGIDMTSSWWDTWNYLGVYKFVPSANGMNVGDAYVKCTGIDSFEYHTNGSVYSNVHWNEIENDLYHIGNIIPGIHDPYNGITFTP